MSEPFSVRVSVRGYETDVLGHLNQAVYLSYAEHARWSLLEAAGLSQNLLIGRGVGPVVLETTIRYLRELTAGDEADVTCAFEWRDGKTFRVRQTITKTDGTPSAEIVAVLGVMDLKRRKLVANPREVYAKLATDPVLFGVLTDGPGSSSA